MVNSLSEFIERYWLGVICVQKTETLLQVLKSFVDLIRHQCKQFQKFFFFDSFGWSFRQNYFSTLIFRSFNTAIHHKGYLIRVVFISKLTNFNRVKVKEVNELGQKLNSNKFVGVSGSWIICFETLVSVTVIVHCNYWMQHLIHLICVLFSLKKCKKHLSKSNRIN